MSHPVHPQPIKEDQPHDGGPESVGPGGAGPPKKRKSSLLQEPNASATSATSASSQQSTYKYRGLCSPEAALKAARAAAKASRRMEMNSRIYDEKKEKSLARFYPSEVELGSQLGRGGFSNVFEVERFVMRDYIWEGRPEEARGDKEEEANVKAAREFLSEHVRREDTEEARYAVKFLRREVMVDGRRYKIGAADLAVEAKFLSAIQHPNIIKIRGITADGVRSFATGLEGGYFLVLDRLYDTLETRIGVWKLDSKKFKGLKSLKDRGGKKRAEMLANRLNVAFDICGALKYLHGNDIIYRDLKPENVGFDIRDDVKIFDFGLAKELQPHNQYDDGTYKLSGNTGSLRYMAPEVAQSKPYNLTADVYSFGTMLWEMISLSKPYDGFNRYMHSEMVVHGGVRPSIPNTWPDDLRSLISMAWSDDLRDRQTMSGAYAVLRRLIVDLRQGDDTGLEHMRRRSTYVLQKGSKNRSDLLKKISQMQLDVSTGHNN